MVFVARPPELTQVQHWALPSQGAHGIDVDHDNELLYVACDGGKLVAVRTAEGRITGDWSLSGKPDATFLNPVSGLVHVALEEPGFVQSVDPGTGASSVFTTAANAPTTAFVPPNLLYVFSPAHGGALHLVETASDANDQH